MTETQPRKLRLLRVIRVIAAAFKYCWKDAGRLFVITWFACALASASRVLLEWLVHSSPPLLPDWTQSAHFDPPTWLAPFFMAPWLAMGWAFVLNEMFHQDARRGIVRTPARELGWLRFELSRTVLVAAAIFAAVQLIEGASRWAHFQILYAAYVAFDPSDLTLTIWSGLLTAIRLAFMIIVFTWCYPLAGLVLRTGTFSFARIRQIMRGNWLRVAVIFLLLSIVLRGLDWLVWPASNWLIGSLTNSATWNLKAAIVRFIVDFPLQMLWIVAWAVTVGIVLHTLDPPAATTERPGGGPAA